MLLLVYDWLLVLGSLTDQSFAWAGSSRDPSLSSSFSYESRLENIKENPSLILAKATLDATPCLRRSEKKNGVSRCSPTKGASQMLTS